MIHLTYTHWPYIAASYGFALLAMLWLSIQLTLRLRHATTRLALLERHDARRKPTA
ncbi:heme exporter protein CcmD [Asaia sp. BMEF1]|uniref:heme exporter protein CcmD n=1 Tax=Asaia sp. BMEF1 TaxID=3155932 RepID=UPI003F67CBE0